jgi:hypothetical protein
MGEIVLFFQSPLRGNDHGGRDRLDGFERICWLQQQRFKIDLTHNGIPNPAAAAFYDLWRVENGKIAERWDTVESIPAKGEWKNSNGKF